LADLDHVSDRRGRKRAFLCDCGAAGSQIPKIWPRYPR